MASTVVLSTQFAYAQSDSESQKSKTDLLKLVSKIRDLGNLKVRISATSATRDQFDEKWQLKPEFREPPTEFQSFKESVYTLYAEDSEKISFVLEKGFFGGTVVYTPDACYSHFAQGANVEIHERIVEPSTLMGLPAAEVVARSSFRQAAPLIWMPLSPRPFETWLSMLSSCEELGSVYIGEVKCRRFIVMDGEAKRGVLVEIWIEDSALGLPRRVLSYRPDTKKKKSGDKADYVYSVCFDDWQTGIVHDKNTFEVAGRVDVRQATSYKDFLGMPDATFSR